MAEIIVRLAELNMCLMHAGFKRIAPGHETGMDLEEPFLTALELFQQRRNKP